MPAPLDTIIYAVTFGLVYIAIPFWFILTPLFAGRYRIIQPRTLRRGLYISVIVMWPLMFAHRVGIEVPYNMARIEDPMYDGVGGNGAVLMFGWLMALMFAFPHVLIRFVIEHVRKKNVVEQVVAPDG